jgi:hypothetical protein
MIIWLIIILAIFLVYTRPWLDTFTDYRGIKRKILWFNNFKGERKFIDLGGDQ